MGQNRTKNDKYEHGIGMSVKSRSRGAFFKVLIVIELNMSTLVLKESHNAKNSPLHNLHSRYLEFQKVQIGPCNCIIPKLPKVFYLTHSIQ